MAKAELNILIVHHDPAEREVMQGILRGHGVEVDVLADGVRAAALVKKRKFDGVFVDGELPSMKSLELVQQIRNSPSNKKAPIIFIANPNSTIRIADAFAAGVTFFLTRPLDKSKVQRLLNTTRGSMLAERRSYHRVGVAVPVRFKAGSKSGRGRSVNICRSGILFQAGGLLKPGDTVEMEIALPQPAGAIKATGDMVRLDAASGAAGVRFTRLPAADIEQLQTFIGL